MTETPPEIPAWQRAVIDAALSGKRIGIRQPGHYRSIEDDAWLCAAAEVTGKKWDVIGIDEDRERAVRRRAREIAARFTTPPT